MRNIIEDMPKLESPFVRKVNEKGEYVVIDQIASGMGWVFNDPDVIAVEKLNGTNVSIIIEHGVIIAVFNRTERIPFFNKGKRHIIEAVQESYNRGYMNNMLDGQWYGEVVGPKLGGNPYHLEKALWIPFATYAKKNLAYKSWGKYPKDFKIISEWFKGGLLPLFAPLVHGLEEVKRNPEKYKEVEGIVFVHPDGRMAKLRVDMFDWFRGERHGEEKTE